MKKALLVTLLASTLGFGAAAVHADDNGSGKRGGHGYSKHEGGKHAGKHRGGRKGGEQMMKRMTKMLDLTEAQQAQLKTIQEAQKTQRESLREAMKSLRTEMKALDTSSDGYSNQVAALADKKANLDRQQFIQRSEARQQFESVLTEEQRAKMKEMQDKRQSRGEKRGGHRNAG
jgi:Spy/CpxP family protein refolding chaperone